MIGWQSKQCLSKSIWLNACKHKVRYVVRTESVNTLSNQKTSLLIIIIEMQCKESDSYVWCLCNLLLIIWAIEASESSDISRRLLFPLHNHFNDSKEGTIFSHSFVSRHWVSHFYNKVTQTTASESSSSDRSAQKTFFFFNHIWKMMAPSPRFA